MTILGYTSRSIPSPKVFEDVLNRRMEAKAAGDKVTANALKLVVNTTYGAMLNQYNALYDPLMGRSVCISGQLLLLELAMTLHKSVPDLKIVQLNTDGIMIEFDEDYYDKVLEITDEWQIRTGFELEEDSVKKLVQKDVNNYIEVQPSGDVKIKGGFLVKGLSKAGAFNVNNNAVIVATAIREYFVNGTPVEETIGKCDDISQFQIIAKAGAKYREAYQLIDGEKTPVQKVNRVYATTNTRYGKLFKVKEENDSEAKIDSLPEHCLIDNNNHATIADIDKQFYIDMAKDRINKFLGIVPEKKSRRTKKMDTEMEKMKEAIASIRPDVLPVGSVEIAPMNVFQKLLEARLMFLDSDVQKTGKNMHLSFKYFELEDIVPVATRIFQKVGLIALANFDKENASITIVNVDKPTDTLVFTCPFNQIQPIISNSGKQATNEMQALGSSITYMRRYLYMIALDICESDSIDANLGSQPAPEPAPKAPATTEKRNEVKMKLTSPSDQADELQIQGLKAVLKKLLEKHPDKKAMVDAIGIQTGGFKNVTKADCEKLMATVNKLLEG